ncbi:MAG: S8 family serine peptidase [Candidatus Thermoplasmatota archaeon]|nr:S8 family serine peptidase [Candidatus Thermoplasmatota archaeon]
MNKKKWIVSGALCCLLAMTAVTASGMILRMDSPFFSLEKNRRMDERSIVVPDSETVLVIGETQSRSETQVSYYKISLDGGASFVRTVHDPSYELGLRYAHFDPLQDSPSVPSVLSASDDTHLYIVQFITQPLEVFDTAITDLGGEVHHYIAQYAYLVEMDDETCTSVASLPYVRWVGPYHPAYRLEEFMLQHLADAEQVYPLQRYNIQVHDIEDKTTIADRISAHGGLVDRSDAGKHLLEATLTPEQLFAVARWDEVLFIDRWSPYEADMNNARAIGGANYIETLAGYDGSGVRGEVFDAGFNLNHVDFASRPLIQHGTVGTNSHGASTSGICFGDGTGNALARGLLPEGQGIVGDYNYIGLTGTSRYTHTGELLQAPYYGVFETASVGSDRTTQYTTISADTDDALFDFDIVHCQSQSNAGDQDSRPQAWAKNIISGGGVYHYDTLSTADDCWCGGASIGPASDGRIKPDLWHFYDKIYTVTTGSTTAYTTNFGGTSGATPIIAGHVGLFFEMWSDGIFGNPVTPGGTVFENRAHMTTAKAMLINTATQYAFTGTTHDKTRMHQGWGMPNLQTMYDLRDKMYIIDETDILSPFEVSSHQVLVEAGEPALKVTMTYADPAGNPGVQSQHRINDLSLRVISPGGTVYYGNNGLLTGVWSTTGGSFDTKNTVECVYIQNPATGLWTVEVCAPELIQDSHVETPELDADYALVVSGVSPVLKTYVDVTVFLEGPFAGSEMTCFLNTYSLLPTSQPYSGAPWYYTGTETVTSIPNQDVVDWVLVELRDTSDGASTATGATQIARQAAFVLRDGSVVGLDGASTLEFDVTVAHNLFVVLWHRNHLSVMSAVPLTEVGAVYSYDFSTGSGQVYGGVNGHVQLTPSVWGMTGGDGDADGQITNGDKIQVWAVQAGYSGYLAGDFTLNSQVDNVDKNDIWGLNAGRGSQVPS